MTALLRQPSSLARWCNSAGRVASRPRYPSSYSSLEVVLRRASRKPRYYATVTPGNRKDDRDGEKAGISKYMKGQSPKKGSQPSSEKDASGTKNVHRDPSQSKLSTEKHSSSQHAATFTRLSPQDERAVQEFASNLKFGLPSSLKKVVDDAFACVRQDGIPPELREVMNQTKNGQSMSFGSLPKVIRLAVVLARKQTDKETAERMSKYKPESSSTPEKGHPQASSSQKDVSGPQNDKGAPSHSEQSGKSGSSPHATPFTRLSPQEEDELQQLLKQTGKETAERMSKYMPEFSSTPEKGHPQASSSQKDVSGPQNDKGAPSHSKQSAKYSSSPHATPFTRLSPQEEDELQQLFSQVKKGLPSPMAKMLDDVLADMKKDGIPEELRELMKKSKNGPIMEIATAAKVLRIASQMARKAAERETAEETGKKKPENSSTQEQDQPQTSTSGSGGGDKQEPNPGKSRSSNFEFKFDAQTFLITAITVMLLAATPLGEPEKELTWQEFQTTFLDKGLVEKLTVVNGNRVRIDLNRDATNQVYPDSSGKSGKYRYYFSIGSVEGFERRLDEAQKELGIPSSERIPVSYKSSISWFSTLLSFGPTLLFIWSIIWLSRRASSGAGGQSGIFGIGKSRARMFNQETDVKVKFKDVAGMDEAKQEIMEFVSFLKTPGQYQRLGAKIPRGAILSGPPGTGKTLLAKATAGESGVPFFSVSGSEFMEMFVGVGPSRVRDLFAKARKNAPCIIFIDEIDAIGKSRSARNFGGGNEERESTLNQILTEMDGFNTSEQVVVLAGTNRPDVLDKALLRPGRFDRNIAIDRPTMEGRKQIFAVHMKKIVIGDDVEQLTGRLAAFTPGFSGADIANCVNEAALIAARSNADKVEMKHFEQAIERIVGGLEKKSLVLSPEEKRTVAYHEAGHAICGWYFRYADPLLKVSIIPRGQGALGYAQYLPPGDTYLMNVNQLMDRMAMTLGGRVSEELHFDTVTSGASDDFNKVTRMATAMVTKWGMSKKIGYLFFEEEDQRLHKPFSEETAKNIDAEVRRIVDEAYKQCRDLLTAKKDEVGKIAEELLRKEVLTRDDMVRILGKRPYEDNKEFSKYFGTGEEAGKSAPPPFPTEETDHHPPEVPSPA